MVPVIRLMIGTLIPLGQTLDGKGGRPLVTSVSYYQSISTMQMKQFASLKSQWKKSGGKLSSSEKIFLDAIQAQMLGANMAASATAVLRRREFTPDQGRPRSPGYLE